MADNIAQIDDSKREAFDSKANSKELLFDLECETVDTMNLLGVLSDAVLNYCENCDDLKAQAAFYGIHTALADRRDALKSLSERF